MVVEEGKDRSNPLGDASVTLLLPLLYHTFHSINILLRMGQELKKASRELVG